MIRSILIGVVLGAVAAFVCAMILRLLEADPSPAVVGGVAGAVASTAVSALQKKQPVTGSPTRTP